MTPVQAVPLRQSMKNVIELLLTLQGLEMGPAPEAPQNAAEISRLRQLIPPQIASHYDRLRARDKKGVSLVRNGVCLECHMHLASGIHAELLRAEDIVICDSCGRYLFAAKDEPLALSTMEPLPVEKPKVKKRRKKEEPSTV
jgi:predicted  nucleic acid-binding Zn-ribbon protein